MIRNEAEAQMRRFREMGFTSKHLDSHDWILFNLPVWLAVKPLIGKYGFETTRVGCEAWMRRKSFFLWKYYQWMNKLIRKNFRMMEAWSGGLRTIQEEQTRIPEGRAEIIMHPDIVDGILVERCNGEIIPLNRFFSDLEQACFQTGTAAVERMEN